MVLPRLRIDSAMSLTRLTSDTRGEARVERVSAVPRTSFDRVRVGDAEDVVWLVCGEGEGGSK